MRSNKVHWTHFNNYPIFFERSASCRTMKINPAEAAVEEAEKRYLNKK